MYVFVREGRKWGYTLLTRLKGIVGGGSFFEELLEMGLAVEYSIHGREVARLYN